MKPEQVRKILFITWDGPGTSYLEGLFLPIFRRLRDDGYHFHVLQFSWDDSVRRLEREALCREGGIPYRRVAIFRRPGAIGPLTTALLGVNHIRRAVRDWDIDTLMPRSLMPALAVLQLRRTERQKLGIIFDADGLAIDERVDFEGMSPQGLTYRLLRDVEAQMLRVSDLVLTRTEASRKVLWARAGAGTSPENYHLVSNGVDPQPFVEALAALPLDERRPLTLCYCGSIGQQYRLPDMLEIASKLRERVRDLRFHVFTRAADEVAAELARQRLEGADWIECRALRTSEVPSSLAACDLGLALRLPHFSTQAVLPIKLGEYLLAGLPVIGTPGVGNSDDLAGGGVFHSGEREDLGTTLDWVRGEFIPQRNLYRRKSHEAGMRYFTLDKAAELYAAAFRDYGSRIGAGAGATRCAV